MHDLTLKKKTGQPLIRHGLGGRYKALTIIKNDFELINMIDLLLMVILLLFSVVLVSWVVMSSTNSVK